jgi:tetratricopeptide (TPR) repeat protein
MMTKKAMTVAAIALTLVFGQTLSAQRRNQDREQEQAEAQQPLGPLANTPEELTAFQALQKEANHANRITLADAFLAKYPTSELTGFVHRLRMESFGQQRRYREAVAAGEAGLAAEIKFMESMIARADADARTNNRNRDRNAPPPIDKNSEAFKKFAADTERAMMYYYQNIMNNYQQLNDAPKIIEWGEKALGQDPEDLFTLLTVSSVLAERPPADEKALDVQMKRAEELAKKAVQKVNALPADPAQKAGILNSVHQTLGLTYIRMKKYGDAQKEYQLAIAAKKDDPISYMRLGIAYAQDQKVDPALDALAKSVYLKGLTEAEARQLLTEVYQAKNKSLDGLDQFIQTAGQKIGQ